MPLCEELILFKSKVLRKILESLFFTDRLVFVQEAPKHTHQMRLKVRIGIKIVSEGNFIFFHRHLNIQIICIFGYIEINQIVTDYILPRNTAAVHPAGDLPFENGIHLPDAPDICRGGINKQNIDIVLNAEIRLLQP